MPDFRDRFTEREVCIGMLSQINLVYFHLICIVSTFFHFNAAEDPSRSVWSVVAHHCCCTNWQVTSWLKQGVASLCTLLWPNDRTSGGTDEVETCSERALYEKLCWRCLRGGMWCVAIGQVKVLQLIMEGQIGVAGLHGRLESLDKKFSEAIGDGVVWCRAEMQDAIACSVR